MPDEAGAPISFRRLRNQRFLAHASVLLVGFWLGACASPLPTEVNLIDQRSAQRLSDRMNVYNDAADGIVINIDSIGLPRSSRAEGTAIRYFRS